MADWILSSNSLLQSTACMFLPWSIRQPTQLSLINQSVFGGYSDFMMTFWCLKQILTDFFFKENNVHQKKKNYERGFQEWMNNLLSEFRQKKEIFRIYIFVTIFLVSKYIVEITICIKKTDNNTNLKILLFLYYIWYPYNR